MLKTRLYEEQENDEDVIRALLDTENFDLIILFNKPYDLLNKYEYRAVLTRKKENAFTYGDEDENTYGPVNNSKWILNIIIKNQGHWQFTPGRWYIDTLLNGNINFKEHDMISINGSSEWEISGMIDIMEEAQMRIAEYEEKETAQGSNLSYEDELKQLKKQHDEKHNDYSKMSKQDLEKLADEALDDNDFETLRKIQPYIKESFLNKKINEAMKNSDKILMGHNKPVLDETSKTDKVCKKCHKIECECGKLEKEEKAICKKCHKIECECDNLDEDFIMPKIDETISFLPNRLSPNQPKGTDKILMGHNTPKKQALEDIKNDEDTHNIPKWRFKEGFPFDEEDEDEDEQLGESEHHITKSYDHNLSREEVKQLIGKILIKYQKTKIINHMYPWLLKNNFGDYQHNMWIRAIADTLFKKYGSTWEPINTNLSIDQLTDKAMDHWNKKMKVYKTDESLNEEIFDESKKIEKDILVNFKNWDKEEGIGDDPEKLFDILKVRHPEYDGQKLREIAYHWLNKDVEDNEEDILMPPLDDFRDDDDAIPLRDIEAQKEEDEEKEKEALNNELSKYHVEEGCCPGPKRPRPAQPRPIFRPRPKRMDEDIEMPGLFK